MSSAPAIVLFDLDGVLVRYSQAARLERLALRSGARIGDVAAALFDSGLEHDADLGRFDAAGQVEALARRLGKPVSLEDCIDARRVAMRVDTDVLALVREVAGRARVSILTNNNFLLRDHLPRICAPLVPLFEGQVFCSAQFGLAKPDPEVFRACVGELGADPRDVLFVDDKAENAAGAREAGLHAHQYRGIAGLRTEFRRLGLIGEPLHAC